jgi:sulfite reductase alpha subunit-like flavoprotein
MLPSLFDRKLATNTTSYDPGDVAVIHPEIPSQDVNSFLSSMGWSEIADSVYTISISLRGKFLAHPVEFYPPTITQIKRFPTTSHPPPR